MGGGALLHFDQISDACRNTEMQNFLHFGQNLHLRRNAEMQIFLHFQENSNFCINAEMQTQNMVLFWAKNSAFDENFIFLPKCRDAEFSAFDRNSQNVHKCRNADENKPNF